MSVEAAVSAPARPRLSVGAILTNPVVLPLLAVLAALLFGLLLIVALGVSMGDAIHAFVNGAFGNSYTIATSLNRAVVFALVGLGFIIANRANLTNVGGEGQIAMGGVAAAAIAIYGGVADLPLGLAFILPMLGAAVAGAAWGGVAGVLKAKVGTNEVISTLLLSFIAVWILYWTIQSESLLRRPMTSSATLPESLPVPRSTELAAHHRLACQPDHHRHRHHRRAGSRRLVPAQPFRLRIPAARRGSQPDRRRARRHS